MVYNECVIVQIDVSSSVPVYRQISDAIRVYLVDGTLGPGASLPTVRQLAYDLGVHFNTVAEAYRLLSDEGWLELRRRRGAVVVERNVPQGDWVQSENDYAARFKELAARAQADGLTTKHIVTLLRRLTEELER